VSNSVSNGSDHVSLVSGSELMHQNGLFSARRTSKIAACPAAFRDDRQSSPYGASEGIGLPCTFRNLGQIVPAVVVPVAVKSGTSGILFVRLASGSVPMQKPPVCSEVLPPSSR